MEKLAMLSGGAWDYPWVQTNSVLLLGWLADCPVCGPWLLLSFFPSEDLRSQRLAHCLGAPVSFSNI